MCKCLGAEPFSLRVHVVTWYRAKNSEAMRAGRRMSEHEARTGRAAETARRVQAIIGTARFGANIAELETQFRAKLRDFVNGEPCSFL